jgi:hypothetical protein
VIANYWRFADVLHKIKGFKSGPLPSDATTSQTLLFVSNLKIKLIIFIESTLLKPYSTFDRYQELY